MPIARNRNLAQDRQEYKRYLWIMLLYYLVPLMLWPLIHLFMIRQMGYDHGNQGHSNQKENQGKP